MSKAETYKTPEQKARVTIDAMLEQAGWKVQDNKMINFNAGLGIAVREYQSRTSSRKRSLRILRRVSTASAKCWQGWERWHEQVAMPTRERTVTDKKIGIVGNARSMPSAILTTL